MKCYPEIKEKEEMRKIIGRYGLTGKQQVGHLVLFVFLLYFNLQINSTLFIDMFLFKLGEPYSESV